MRSEKWTHAGLLISLKAHAKSRGEECRVSPSLATH